MTPLLIGRELTREKAREAMYPKIEFTFTIELLEVNL